MLKTLQVALLACLVAPMAMAADDTAPNHDAHHMESSASDHKGGPDGDGRKGPPPEAFKACEGKSAGDKVSMSGPEGKSMSATCHDMKGKLAAMPEHGGDKESHMHGDGQGHPKKDD